MLVRGGKAVLVQSGEDRQKLSTHVLSALSCTNAFARLTSVKSNECWEVDAYAALPSTRANYVLLLDPDDEDR
eukprot:5980639-Amphidinium_carterae.1